VNCDDDYLNKPEKYKCLGNTIDGNIFHKHYDNDQETKILVMADFTGKIHTSALHWSQNGRLFCISTAALITNISLTPWGNGMSIQSIRLHPAIFL
jgi:hypothetical protein